jgi:flagellar protein FliO/FliZ
MNTSSEVWFTFIKSVSMLFVVLASLILAFYLIKKFSTAKGIKGSKDFIKVLCVHYLSPKEKLVLLDVLGETILIGVTPSRISKISSLDVSSIDAKDGRKIDFSDDEDESSSKFSDFLAKKLGGSLKNTGSDFLDKKPK